MIEPDFHRLEGAPLSIDPLFVKRDDHSAFDLPLFNHLSNDSQPRAIQDLNLLALDVDQPGCG